MFRDRHPLQLLYRINLLACCLLANALLIFAQGGDRQARTAQWDGYALPAGTFTRLVDAQKGYGLWHPADWKPTQGANGMRIFSAPVANTKQGHTSIVALTEEIPDGYGLANYTSATLQGLRNARINEETMTVRRVMSGGIEWRELFLELEENGQAVHETLWLTAHGPRAYLFMLVSLPGEHEQIEPLFKRFIQTVRIGAAGHWDEAFEKLRSRFPASVTAGDELSAVQLAENVRTGRTPLDKLLPQLRELAERSPALVFDLCSDPDPQVRAAAATALSQARSAQTAPLDEALIWVANDKEPYVSARAAQALATRGAAALNTVKNNLALLAENGAAVRLGALLGEEAANELVAALWQSDDAKQQLAGLQLALVLPRLRATLPYNKFFNSANAGVIEAAVAVVQLHHPADAVDALTALLRDNTELWAVRALGEIGPPTLSERFKARKALIDTRIAKLLPPPPPPAPVARRTGKRTAAGVVRGKKVYSQPLPPDAITISANIEAAEPAALTPAIWKDQPETSQLSWLRSALITAMAKLDSRDRWAQAKDEAARKAVFAAIRKEHRDLIEWAQVTLREPEHKPELAAINFARLNDAPTTGETFFPQQTISYVLAPNFAATLDKLDAALAGVQMATVRDQMTFALLLKLYKTQLAASIGAEATGGVGTALGLELNAPLALASWPAERNKTEARQPPGIWHHAAVARVNDRARFEQALALQLTTLGGLETLAGGAAVLARFAGMLPGALPLIFTPGTARLLSVGHSEVSRGSINQAVPATLVWRQEKLGEWPVMVLEQTQLYQFGGVKHTGLYVAYFGATALVASSRAALIDALNTSASQSTLAQNPAFTQARAATGELLFFSDLGALLKEVFTSVEDDADDKGINPDLMAFAEAFGVETGALRLTPHSWEADFKLKLADSELLKSLRPFKAADLAAPRDLLPRTTVLYGGVVCDPPKLLAALKKLAATSTAKTPGKERDGGLLLDSKELDAEIENAVVPQMQGEISGALLNLQPMFDYGGTPALVLAVKLKSGELATRFRAGKLFAGAERVKGLTALGGPVASLGAKLDGPFVTVTNEYLLLADSVTTLNQLKTPEKFAATRDFTRSAAAATGELAFFATYNIEAAFEEARQFFSKSEESKQGILPILSAVTHAFHSQRAHFAHAPDGLTGSLAVSFDREGRYAVGALARNAENFDVANALIEAKGVNIPSAPRAETLTLRLTAKQPGIAPRVRDDLGKFPWQRVENENETAVVFTSNARRIPAKQTIKLPVKGAEFEPYLASNRRVNAEAAQVVALGQQVAGDDRDGRSVARKLGEWTFKNLKWKKVQSDVVETLASREADCLEHSELYVALARSLGLPARVVSGAAFSGGAFGAHAWVEVYLGKWVELDPTWGLMDHVDATHLRFDGDTFANYAMLNQLDLEVVAARNTVAEAQRDPLQLVKAYGKEKGTIELACDLGPIAERALGPGAFAQLNVKQRTAVIKAFDRLVAELAASSLVLRDKNPVLQSEVQGDRATVTTLHAFNLWRFHLAAREGAWYITEIEDLDEALPLFADALRNAARGTHALAKLREQAADKALKRLDERLATEGESPQLLLLKARILSNQETEEAETVADKPAAKAPAAAQPSPVIQLLRQITTRWPDFAPAQLALSHELRAAQFAEEKPENKERTLQALRETLPVLQRYAQLVPYDPRPWSELSNAYEQLGQLDEAEAALRQASVRDRESLDYPAEIVSLHLRHKQAAKAQAAFAALLKITKPDEAFDAMQSEYEIAVEDEEEQKALELAQQFEALLLAFPKELNASRTGLRALADAQKAQDKSEAALKTLQRILTLTPEATDYYSLAEVQRQLRRYQEAIASATQAIKMESTLTGAYLERACALTKLGRKQEALADLRHMLKESPYSHFLLDDPDLEPLANLPEYKTMVETAKREAKADDSPKPEDEKPKPDKP